MRKEPPYRPVPSARPLFGNKSLRRRLGFTHYFVLTIMSLALLEMIFLTDSGSTQSRPGDRPGVAAVATQPVSVKSSGLGFELPRTKDEARAFTRQHESLFNFNEVSRLRQERAAVFGEAVNSNPAAPLLAGTPGLTDAANSLSAVALTPRPTNARSSFNAPGPNAFTPATPPNACGPLPADDIYEVDDTWPNTNLPPTNSKPISPGTISSTTKPPVQNHTLTSVSSAAQPTPGNGDQDWVRFAVSSEQFYYVIQTSQFSPATVDTVLELYRYDTANPGLGFVLVNSNDNKGGGDTIVYDPSVQLFGNDVSASVTFYARVYGAPNASCTGSYGLSVGTTGSLSFLTPTATASPTPTGTAVTATPDPCTDKYEPDNTPDKAQALRTSFSPFPSFGGTPGAQETQGPNNNVQSHFICPSNDVDWVYIDLVKGKPYSLYTAQLQGGLDTLLILFEQDSAGNLNTLYSSDDFPGLGLASRIDFMVPTTPTTPEGETKRYYAVVKDVSGKGVANLGYLLTLASAGNGKGDCVDSYESDGLQYLAKEILINEIQQHVLCPDGDADWVKFFAKSGRSYTLSTAFNPTPGLDTYMFVFSVLFDPNDPTKVVSQNEIAASKDNPATLSSEATFQVPVDGIYYAQVKNNGDIGRPGFNYSLTYRVTGSSGVPPTPAPTVATPVATVASGTLTARAVASATALKGQTATAGVNATLTALATSSPAADPGLLALNFADPSFQSLWYYSDLAVAQNQTQRSWEWGPKPGIVRRETYAESPGGERQVQYFEKSRMEINNPKGNRGSPWFVSNGLLVREMISGQLAKGDQTFESRPPARYQIAGDLTGDNPAPTYASFAALITNGSTGRTADQTGQVVSTGLDATGKLTSLSAPPEALKLVAYLPETGHNIPQVFWEYMQGAGKVWDNGYKEGALRNWLFAMGYPLSEPYWIKARVGGVEKDVLVQVYERRLLTYTPSNSAEWRVEMANVGQHYYLWRYGRNLYEQ